MLRTPGQILTGGQTVISAQAFWERATNPELGLHPGCESGFLSIRQLPGEFLQDGRGLLSIATPFEFDGVGLCQNKHVGQAGVASFGATPPVTY